MRAQESDSDTVPSTIQAGFRAQSIQHPNHLCLRIPTSKAAGAWELNYREVDCWSDALANQLREAGVGPGDRVGLCVERSAAAVAAMLGVVKCGAVYVPICPDYPKSRIELMVQDAGLTIAFATPIFARKMTQVGVKTLLLDEHPSTSGSEALSNVFAGTRDQPAYIIYTSGSTGRPKGVEVPQRGVLRLVSPANTYCTFNDSRRFLQLAPLFFDAATLEVWAPLLNGGCCVIQPGDGIPDPALLARVLREENVTSLWLTASLFNWLIDNEALADIPVQELLVGGEALSLAHIKRAQKQLPHAQLINGYGPTETTTFACCYRIPNPIPESWTAIPIGAPIHKTQVTICDEQQQEVAQGEIGELLISGDGVSLGYRNLPERSRESFVNLSVQGVTQTVYRTGDQARINEAGLVEYIGRVDDQVKMSGYRIELGEINNCLTSHPDLLAAAVVVHTNTHGGRRLVSYMVAKDPDTRPHAGDIRSFVHAALPHYMVPNVWVFIDKLPLTPNGKLDRDALPDPISTRPDIGVEFVAAKDDAEKFIAQLWCEHLCLDSVGVNDRYFELGGTSIAAVNFVAQLSQELGQRIPIATFFYAPTIRSFVAALWSDHTNIMTKKFPALVSNYQEKETVLSQYQTVAAEDDIAIIGIAGRFAGADNTTELWKNLINGVEALRFSSDDELRSAGVAEDDIQDPDYIRAYFSMDDIECFDANFFGYKPREVELMDPQHRIFLEQAWVALDNAGYSDTENNTNKIGVFGGIARDAYSHHYIAKHPKYEKDVSEFYVLMGNDKSFPTTRVSYQLNLKGPAVSVQTACSSGGTALHLAIQSLKAGDCEIAVIGGCRALVPEKQGHSLSEEGALSNDGHLRAFDAKASGMVRGSGAAFVVIKRLKSAIADGDCIRAVIKATAINNDGNAKVGFTAPSVEGQSEVVTKALVTSGVNPESIGYVEAHGTGTLLGDPIEVAGLTKAYRRFTDAKGYSRIGSIKANVGHTDAGSAIAGIVKSVLVLEHGKIPASLNYTAANPNIDFDNSPFQVSDKLQDWPIQNEGSRYAAVSSFGLGGTNFHAILEQAPARTNIEKRVVRPQELFTLSAKSAISLNANIAELRNHLRSAGATTPADLAYSVNKFRPQFPQRAAIIMGSDATILHIERAQQSVSDQKGLYFSGLKSPLSLIKSLYQNEPYFRRQIELCAEIYTSDHAIDIKDRLFSNSTKSASEKADKSALIDSAIDFSVEYALAKLWLHWTDAPQAILTHMSSLAAAACIADMLNLHKAITVHHARASDQITHTGKLAKALEDIIPAVAKIAIVNANDGRPLTIPDLMSAELWNSPAPTTANVPAITDAIENIAKSKNVLWVVLGHPAAASDLTSMQTPLIASFNKAIFLSALAADSNQANKNPSLALALGQYWLTGQKVNWSNYYEAQNLRKVPLPAFKFNRKRYLLDLPERDPILLLFQSDSGNALQQSIQRWSHYLCDSSGGHDLHKFALPFSEPYKAVKAGIAAITPSALPLAIKDFSAVTNPYNSDAELVYLLPGGGAQYLAMGKGLYDRHPLFREALDEGIALFASNTGQDLRALMFPAPYAQEYATAQLKRPSLQLPAIFILQMALAKLWRHWGAKPDALIGHSLGENTAACLAGVLTYEDALGLVSLRGKLFETVEPGGMLSVSLAADDIKKYLGEHLDLATINSAGQCTVSGSAAAIEAVRLQFESEDIDVQVIPIDIAAHSRHLEPILKPFGDYLRSVNLRKPDTRFISNVTGTWITDEQATDPEYWVKHLRSTVRFSDGAKTLLDKKNRVFLEVGPGKILGSLLKLHDHGVSDRTLSSLRHAKENTADIVFSLNTAAKLWSLGLPIDWLKVSQELPNTCVLLPPAPLAKESAFDVIAPASIPAPHQIMPSMEQVSATPNTTNFLRPTAGVNTTVSRREYIETTLKGTITDLSGIASDALDTNSTFVNLGFDSLFLTQVNGRLKKTFKLKLTLKQLMSEAPTIALLSDYIEANLPEGALAEEMAASSPPIALALAPNATSLPTMPLPQGGNFAAGLDTHALAQVLATQIQASNALLSILHGSATTFAPAKPVTNNLEVKPTPIAQVPATKQEEQSEPIAHGPFRPIVKSITGELTPKQSRFLREFIAMYADKTKESKRIAAEIRPFYADPRTVLGFKSIWKEITYSIVAKRSKGGRTWDVDGNEYIDCMGGFGSIFFGHAPDFIMDAIKSQADLSVDYGPQSAMAGETARLICEVTGYDRASFCNTGSEAVLAATRIARTVTGNDLIVTFSGDYHGIFDEMLIRSQVVDGERRNKPIAPGIPLNSSSNVLMLAYDDPEALEIIRARADEIAGVLIEPIQSRFPEIQPKAFIHQLRALTRELEIPLIFDEVITGFRLHPRGAQAWFDVEADISCYGKVIGGGMPIGVVAGRAQYLDVLDGGPWQYGDESFPEAGVTYFAGTFVRHPLAIAAANAVIKEIKKQGPSLHLALNYKTSIFAERINRHYREQDIPVEIVYFGSVFLVRYKGEADFEFLYFLILRINGGHHIWGPRPGFMNIAHTEADIEALVNAFIIAGDEFRRGGFFHAKEDRPEEFYPWTPAQNELWLACDLGDAASAAYNEQVCVSISSSLDSLSLEFATDRTLNRHPSLRSVVSKDKLGMRVLHYMSPEYRYVDISNSKDAEVEYQRLATINVDTAFDFFNGPLVRVLAVKLSDNETRICLAGSHLVCDGWSLEKIMEDLAGYYTAIYQGRYYRGKYVPHLSEFVTAKDTQLRSEEYADAKKFWCSKYSDSIPPALGLPLDHPRPKLRAFNGQRQEFRFENEIVQPLRDYAKSQGCTSFVLLLAAFKVLLSKLSGQKDIVVGVPAAGQPILGLPTLVAHDVSYLPLRSAIHDRQKFQDFLLYVRDSFLDAKDNQVFAFGELLQSLKIPREAGRLPLVSANFNLDFPFNPLDFNGLSGEMLSSPRSFVKYDLSFNLTDEGDFLRLEIDHCSDLFERETVKSWVQSYLEILTQIGTDPQTPVGKLRAGDQAETLAKLTQWNNTDKAFPLETSTLHGLFEAQAKRTPDSTAIVFEGESLSYRELDQKADALAAHLLSLGATKDQPIALLQERSIFLPISLLAILKSGCAYLPLDPEHPMERLHYILQEACVKIVIADKQHVDKAPSTLARIDMSQLDSLLIAHSNAKPSVTVAPHDLAYVIYTSGSTGQPKGVMVEHNSVCNRLFWMQDDFQLGLHDKILQKTPYTFDVSVWEFFLPLMTGAALVIARPDGHKDTVYLITAIREHAISLIHFVPSMLALFLSDGKAKSCKLKRVVCSGEVLSSELQKTFFRTLNDTELYNYYGPTEAAIDVTRWRCSVDDKHPCVPIGYAVANTQLYILDEAMQPVAPGTFGELYIGGVQVARGYLNRQELTKERFIENPFKVSPSDKHARLYKTGDIARHLSDGAIEYAGRNDFQVKIRGLRIELGEIESALCKLASIKSAVVIADVERGIDARLIGYLVSEGNEIDFNLIREHLLKHIPDYMVPQHFIALESIPLTSSGKIDRKALPAVTTSNNHDTTQLRGDMEEKVSLIWTNILDINAISATDNFFQLGGHSLQGAKIVSDTNREFATNFSLRDLFLAPNIRDYAALISTRIIGARPDLPRTTIETYRGDRLAPASSQQQRLWYMEQVEPDTGLYHMEAIFHMSGPLNYGAFEKAVKKLTSRHEILRTNFVFKDKQLLQSVRPLDDNETCVVKIESQSLKTEADIVDYVHSRKLINLDLEIDKLFYLELYPLSDTHHILLMFAHHIIFDGSSFDLALRELSSLYLSEIETTESPLPLLPIQYRDFAHWQQEQLQSDALQSQLQFWRENLSGELPILALPEDFSRPARQSSLSKSIPITIAPNSVSMIDSYCKANSCTLFMFLISVFTLALHRHSRQNDIIIGAPVSGRIAESINDLLGFFVNTVAFRFRVDSNISFSDWLSHVKQVCTDAYDNQHFPFEELVKHINPERDLSRSPIFQAFFLYEDISDREYTLGNIDLTQIDSSKSAVQTDVDFWLKRTNSGIAGGLDFATSIFSSNTAQSLLDSFTYILDTVTSAPTLSLATLFQASEQERSTIERWNATRDDFGDELFMQRFLTIASIHPKRSAVSSQGEKRDYATLNLRSSQLANYLIAQGVSHGALVGICLERSVELLIGILAIWKAGAAYVPLDPEYPEARLAYMLEASNIEWLLTQSSLTQVAETHVCRRICIDTESAPINTMTSELRPLTISPSDIAYVIFTSGSTGKPKGVQVQHGALNNFLMAMKSKPGISADDQVLAVTSLSFDIAALELYLPLLVGAHTVIASAEQAADGAKLKSLYEEESISFMQATPSTWRLLLAADWRPNRQHKFLCGGEAFPHDLALQLLNLSDHVWNMYGPTETTIWSTCEKLTPPLKNISIGAPIANTQCYILDDKLNQLPIGVAGELYIGGEGVTRGYLGRDDLTAERYIANPFSQSTSDRLYKTGDLACWQRGGKLKYLQRVDSQVKLRGYRIELGEVESVLSEIPEVMECAVSVVTFSQNDSRLSAHILFKQGSNLTNSELRDRLRAKLPSYMVPQLFIEVHKMPLTPNGKVDRKALPKPVAAESQIAADSRPKSETEKAIASLWAGLLGTKSIGIHCQFFDAGGHSLLALEAIHKMHALFGVRITPLDMLTSTLEQISSSIDAQKVNQHPFSAGDKKTDEPQIAKTGLIKRILEKFI